MSYDIYGNPLRRGHCEVHPHVHEEYPCSVCMKKGRQRQEAQSPAQCNGNPAYCESAYYLGQAQEEITRLNGRIQALQKDAERLDWLADPKNSIGNVQLPTGCVERNPHSLRDAIDDAMELEGVK